MTINRQIKISVVFLAHNKIENGTAYTWKIFINEKPFRAERR